MHADDTIHFDNPRTHPDVVYAPMHLIRDVPLWVGHLLLVVGALLLVAAYSAWHGENRRLGRKILALGVIVGLIGTGFSTLVGSHIGRLSDKGHFFAMTDHGDAQKVYVTRAEALAVAQQTSRDQGISVSSARTVAYPWRKWPIPKYGPVETAPPYSIETFPEDAQWTDADLDKIDAWVKKVYDATPDQAPYEPKAHFHPLVDTVHLLNDSPTEADGVKVVPYEPGAGYQCKVEVTNVVYNDLSQPVTAVPQRLVCASSFTSPDPVYPLTLAQQKKRSSGS